MEIQATTLDELKAHREEVNTRIRELERQTLEEIQAKAQSLGFQLIRHGHQPEEPKRPAVKYRDNDGNTWSGKGRRPEWVQRLLDEGGDVELYRIN